VPGAASKLAPPPQQRQLAEAEDKDRCARRSDGQIIARQGLTCDLAGMAEKFISLGRDTLDHDDDVGQQAAARLAEASQSGGDR